MERVLVGDIELEYETQGSGEPILFIHGAGVAASFLPLMQEPSLSSFQLIRYHRRGFAGSDAQKAPSSMKEQASDAIAILQYLGIEKAHIVGHSYGGAISLQLCLDAPELVHSLVVLEPAIPIPGAPPPPELLASFELYFKGDGVGAINTFFSWAFGEEWPEGTERGVQGGPDQARKDAQNQFEFETAIQNWQFGKDEASKILQPTLFMMGSLTPSEITSSKEFLKSWIPQLEDFTVEGVNHSLPIQDAQGVAQPIADFLNKYSFRV